MVFTVGERDRVRDRILEMAAGDERVTAGAAVGSLAMGEGDRWSDLDLAFGVSEAGQMGAVLDSLSAGLAGEFGAVHLFDLPSGASLYRVLLVPGCLQVDISVTPEDEFGAVGPKFRLLFGKAVEKAPPQASSMQVMVGYAVHHAMRARFAIERGRWWQAEYWISALRDYVLSMACVRLELPSQFGRGFDLLPANIQEQLKAAVVRSLDRGELLRALTAAVEGLLAEMHSVPKPLPELVSQLRLLQGERPST